MSGNNLITFISLAETRIRYRDTWNRCSSIGNQWKMVQRGCREIGCRDQNNGTTLRRNLVSRESSEKGRFFLTIQQNFINPTCAGLDRCQNIRQYLYWPGTAVAQWLRCCATNQKVIGSIPAGVIGILHWHKILPIALCPWGRLSL